jgi:hypothetical protein
MPSPQIVPLAEPSGRERAEPATPGFSDQFGDRLLTFDTRALMSIEQLRFKPELSASAAFEAALRDRVEHTHAPEPVVVSARAVERRDGALLLVSRRVGGRRLSDLVSQGRGTKMALEFIRQTVPALASLTKDGRRFAHGALTLERVVASPEGRLTIMEHPLGAAVEALGWPRGRLQAELGLAVPDEDAETAEFDGRIDAIQVGFVALSLWLGRRLDPSDFPGKIPDLLDDAAIVTSAHAPDMAKMREFIERALQEGARPITSARDALAALSDLAPDPDTRRPEPARAVVIEMPPAAIPIAAPAAPVEPEKPRAPAAVVRRPSRRRSWHTWAFGIVLLLAIGEGIVIGRDWLLRRPLEPAGARFTAAAAVVPGPASAPAAAPSRAPAPAPVPEPPRAAALDASATRDAAAPHFGAMTIVSAIELQIYEGGTRIGSTGGPIGILEGVHNIELANPAVGFLTHETVTVKPGELASRTIRLPNGKISINAIPWADVLIDGTAAGQTPLANLSVTIGEHQITFRHPQLGEQRQTALVKVDGVTRISASMQR